MGACWISAPIAKLQSMLNDAEGTSWQLSTIRTHGIDSMKKYVVESLPVILSRQSGSRPRQVCNVLKRQVKSVCAACKAA